MTNYPPPSFSPDTGFFYVQENNSLRLSYLIDPDPRGSMGLGGTMGGGGLNYGSFIDAIDYKTGKVVWRHEICGTRRLSDHRRRAALRRRRRESGGMGSGQRQAALAFPHRRGGQRPETYMLDGNQYVLATGGDQLFAFVLN